MTTKEKFLKELKEVCDRYNLTFIKKDTHSLPSNYFGLNNLPNYEVLGVQIAIPNEGDCFALLSSKEIVDYICNSE